ncbi:MAG TPA: GreA/GreB family elongation factor [Cyclobacteriaceae bacterium]|nr:GreA/GreB family elongation factor [Cyclobacteriaceae bacterium]
MPKPFNIKESLYNYCMQYVEERIARIQNEIDLQQEAANEETKSSAGDKYETGRAMAQLEIERNAAQLKEAEKLRSFLQSIVRESTSEVIIQGSLVTTSKGVFYIAISIGAITLHQQSYFIVSPDSPIGKLLLGKKVGETMMWKNERYNIMKVE